MRRTDSECIITRALETEYIQAPRSDLIMPPSRTIIPQPERITKPTRRSLHEMDPDRPSHPLGFAGQYILDHQGDELEQDRAARSRRFRFSTIPQRPSWTPPAEMPTRTAPWACGLGPSFIPVFSNCSTRVAHRRGRGRSTALTAGGESLAERRIDHATVGGPASTAAWKSRRTPDDPHWRQRGRRRSVVFPVFHRGLP